MALDAEQVIKKVYSSADTALKAKDSGAAAAWAQTNLSAKQVLKRVFDATAVALKMVKV